MTRSRRKTAARIVAAAVLLFSFDASAEAQETKLTAHTPELSVIASAPDYVDLQVHIQADVQFAIPPFRFTAWTAQVEWADHPFEGCNPLCPTGTTQNSGLLSPPGTLTSSEARVSVRLFAAENAKTWYFRVLWDALHHPQYAAGISPPTYFFVPHRPTPNLPTPATPTPPRRLFPQAFKDTFEAALYMAIPQAIMFCLARRLDLCLGALGQGASAGVFLLVDPPDPDFATFAEVRPLSRLADRARCPRFQERERILRRALCSSWKRAMRPYARSMRRMAEIYEALAVTANRFLTARNSGSVDGQWLHVAAAKYFISRLKPPLAQLRRDASFVAAMSRYAGVKRRTKGAELVIKARRLGDHVPPWLRERFTERHVPWDEGLLAAVSLVERRLRRGIDLRDIGLPRHQWPTMRHSIRFNDYEALKLAQAIDAKRLSTEDRVGLQNRDRVSHGSPGHL